MLPYCQRSWIRSSSTIQSCTLLHNNTQYSNLQYRSFSSELSKSQQARAAAAKRKQRGNVDDGDSTLKQEFKSMVHKMLQPQPYIETRTQTQLLSDQLFATAYSRYKMTQHRQLQLQQRNKLIRRWEAINSLPDVLRDECMVVDTTLWPLWMTQPTEQPGRNVHTDYDFSKIQDHIDQQQKNNLTDNTTNTNNKT